MENQAIQPVDASDATIVRGGTLSEAVVAEGRYTIECYDSNGNLKWSDFYDNTVTTVGKNDLLDKYLEGSGYTAAWYLGLISSTSYSAIAAGDTMSSHAGWTEFTSYSEATRVAPTFAAASSGSKATASVVAFTINGSGTVKGSFLTTGSAKSGTAGILYSAGLFTGGDKIVASADTVNVTYTASA